MDMAPKHPRPRSRMEKVKDAITGAHVKGCNHLVRLQICVDARFLMDKISAQKLLLIRQ